MLKHVLVPLDGSELAYKALDYAAEVTEKGGTITLLMAVEPPESIAYGMYGAHPVAPGAVIDRPLSDFQAISDSFMAQGKEYLQKRAAELQKAGYKVNSKVEFGGAADLIIETAESAKVDAIVMSTHGRSGLSRWILGSITSKVLGAAPCPVLVIPPARTS